MFQAAGRGGQYLDSLEKELDLVSNNNSNESNEQIQVLKEKFPRGGAMGLLEMNPHLVCSLWNFILNIKYSKCLKSKQGISDT